ncbi:MAG: SDR family NAD(P)-dependent oxidoreductase [Legionellaceae bacterium]|nr:SDR family NAD(P)-dependent oxidoreductase [Legionellaceae bacterium]
MDSNPGVAVITGAASGLGLSLAKQCLHAGMNIVMADNNVSLLCNQVEWLSNTYSAKVLAVVTDVSRADSVKQLAQQTMEQFGQVDWLFNNAGICGQLAPVWELPTEHLKSVMDVNLFGVMHGIRAFMPYLLKQKIRSRIINISSLYGLCSGSQLAAYAMSKSAVVSLSESMYFDLKRLNKPVDVSVACPSFADTSLLSNSAPLRDHALHELMKQMLARSRSSDDVASAIIAGVKQEQFYILPDQEVKQYCQQRAAAIDAQTEPYRHSVEQVINILTQRATADLGEYA